MHTPLIILGAKGRMGSTITTLALADPALEVKALIEREEKLKEIELSQPFKTSSLEEALQKFPGSVVIDFTTPKVSLDTARLCANLQGKAVIGTTGFSPEEISTLKDLAQKTPLLLAPNMSVGINVLLKILPQLVTLLGEQYDLEISEIHHKFKKDAPSGTALKLAECLAAARKVELKEVARYCREGIIGQRPAGEIGLQTLRGGDVVGDHTVYFFGPGERIEVTHRAHSRETFAQGALRAAKWLYTKPAGKLYSMADVLS